MAGLKTPPMAMANSMRQAENSAERPAPKRIGKTREPSMITAPSPVTVVKQTATTTVSMNASNIFRSPAYSAATLTIRWAIPERITNWLRIAPKTAYIMALASLAAPSVKTVSEMN